VPKYDSSAGEYNWVYRPEMHFSMFNLDPQMLTLTRTDGTTSEHDADAEDRAVYSEDIDSVDLAYTLLTDPETLQLETFDGTRELVFTFGDQTQAATVGTDAESGAGTVTFTNAATLGNASADEFATIRLVQNGDEPNVLWKHEFKDVKIVLEDYEGTIKPGQSDLSDPRKKISFFPSPIAKRLLNRYMDDTGLEYKLTGAEMIMVAPVVTLHASEDFKKGLLATRTAGETTWIFNGRGWGGASTSGTLGNFTIEYRGLVSNCDTAWEFEGRMTFHDVFDFDIGATRRPFLAQVKVVVGNVAIPGRPFKVSSEWLDLKQRASEKFADWVGSGFPVRHDLVNQDITALD